MRHRRKLGARDNNNIPYPYGTVTRSLMTRLRTTRTFIEALNLMAPTRIFVENPYRCQAASSVFDRTKYATGTYHAPSNCCTKALVDCSTQRVMFNRIHHVAIICSDYEKSKDFYVNKLGLTVVQEVYRAERKSYKLDLSVGGLYQVELFSFENPPARTSRPEAAGLRHLAFEVDDIHKSVEELNSKGVVTEEVRIDEYTGKKFTFFADPDDLPLEIYER